MSKYKLWRALRGGVWAYDYGVWHSEFDYAYMDVPVFPLCRYEDYRNLTLLERIGVVL